MNIKFYPKIKSEYTLVELFVYNLLEHTKEAVASLAVVNSSFSGFRRDMNFKHDVCDDLSENLIKSSVKECNTSKVVIVDDNKIILRYGSFSPGFIIRRQY